MKTDYRIDDLKSELADAIALRITAMGLTPSEASESGILDVNRNDLGKILNHKFDGQSLQKIVRLAHRAGLVLDVEIRENQKAVEFV